jgi:hypothetical protein
MLIAIAAVLAIAAATRAEDIETTSHKVYKNATITRAEPDGIMVTYSDGIVKLRFDELPESIRSRFNYDPEAAKRFAAETEKKQRALYLQSHPETPDNHTAAPSTAVAAPTPVRSGDPLGPVPLKTKSGLELFPQRADGITPTYESAEEIAADRRSRAENLMLPKGDVEKSSADVPPGGRLIMQLYRPTVGSANTKWFTVIVIDDRGTEVTRVTGRNKVASVPSSSQGNWRNLMIVDLPAQIDRFVDIFVVDAIQNQRSHFRLSR